MVLLHAVQLSYGGEVTQIFGEIASMYDDVRPAWHLRTSLVLGRIR
jgi:hypothetical protein